MTDSNFSLLSKADFTALRAISEDIDRLKADYLFQFTYKELTNNPQGIGEKFERLTEKVWNDRLDILKNKVGKQAVYKWFFNSDEVYDLSQPILRKLPTKDDFIKKSRKNAGKK